MSFLPKVEINSLESRHSFYDKQYTHSTFLYGCKDYTYSHKTANSLNNFCIGQLTFYVPILTLLNADSKVAIADSAAR